MIKNEFKLKYADYGKGFVVRPIFSKYAEDGSWRLDLVDVVDGARVATVTVLVEGGVPDMCVYAQTWGENQGLIRDVIAAGLLRGCGKYKAKGSHVAEMFQLLVDPNIFLK